MGRPGQEGQYHIGRRVGICDLTNDINLGKLLENAITNKHAELDINACLAMWLYPSRYYAEEEDSFADKKGFLLRGVNIWIGMIKRS